MFQQEEEDSHFLVREYSSFRLVCRLPCLNRFQMSKVPEEIFRSCFPVISSGRSAGKLSYSCIERPGI